VNAFKLEDDKISPSVRGVGSSLRSLIDGRVRVERVELLLIVEGTDDKLVLLVTFDGSDISSRSKGKKAHENNLIFIVFNGYDGVILMNFGTKIILL
jgi:hypothetical protein